MTGQLGTHTAINGRTIYYDASVREVDLFLRRMRFLLATSTEADMHAFAMSSVNPLLGPHLDPDLGSITNETLANPAWHVALDLIARKHLVEQDIRVDLLAALYTLTVAEAAALVGVHESAIRQAIAAYRLPCWVRSGRCYLAAHSLRGFKPRTRGPKPTKARKRSPKK